MILETGGTIADTLVLDEADYLGDQVAILQAPGKLLALDSPVALKHRLGKGFSITLDKTAATSSGLVHIQRDHPDFIVREVRGKYHFSTGSADISVVRQLVESIRRNSRGTPFKYQVNSATLEQVFLDINALPEDQESPTSTLAVADAPIDPMSSGFVAPQPSEKDLEQVNDASSESHLNLTPGRKPAWTGIFMDTWTIVQKRFIILRRSWLLPVVAIIMVICATCIPLFFLGDREQTCALITNARQVQTLTFPRSLYPFVYPPLLVAPEDALGGYSFLFGDVVQSLPNNQTFVDTIRNNPSAYSFGGISLDPDTAGQSLFAWEGSAVLNKGLSALNLMSNALLNRISTVGSTNIQDAFRINLDFQFLPSPSFLSTAQAMKWIAFL